MRKIYEVSKSHRLVQKGGRIKWDHIWYQDDKLLEYVGHYLLITEGNDYDRNVIYVGLGDKIETIVAE